MRCIIKVYSRLRSSGALVPVESSGNSLLHGSLPVVATVRSDIDGSLIGDHLCALLAGSFDVNLYVVTAKIMKR